MDDVDELVGYLKPRIGNMGWDGWEFLFCWAGYTMMGFAKRKCGSLYK